MKNYLYICFLLAGSLFMASCSDDDDKKPGNPVIHSATDFSAGAMFGDSLSFSVNVSDTEVALSTLKAQLYYGQQVVSEVVIRTKTDGDYSGRFYVPFYQYTPDETAKVVYVLQNVNLTTTTKIVDIPLTRPDYSYLTLISEETQYRMERVGLYEYEARYDFPMKVNGYIVAPAMAPNGNEITFGWEDDKVIQGSTTNIPFSNKEAGEYSISFNTFNYKADPFIVAYAINGNTMERIDDDRYQIDLDLAQGEEIQIEGIEGIEAWWIDPDFFEPDGNGNYTFVPAEGRYRITADFNLEYFRVEALNGNDFATLNSDGTGALWAIGDNIGKPSVRQNLVGWSTDDGLLVPYIGDKKFRISFVAGETVSVESINFKFFHEKGWTGFSHETMEVAENDFVYMGDGSNDRDSGNLGLKKNFTAGKTYVFTVDLSNGNDNAVLTVEEK